MVLDSKNLLKMGISADRDRMFDMTLLMNNAEMLKVVTCMTVVLPLTYQLLSLNVDGSCAFHTSRSYYCFILSRFRVVNLNLRGCLLFESFI